MKYYIELLQDPREAKGDALAKLQGQLKATVKMEVPRTEFYNAAKHFKGKIVADLFLGQEQTKKYHGLCLSLVGITLARYTKEMFKEGRWADKGGDNLHIIKGD